GGGRPRLTKGDALEFDPAGSPDGTRIAFVAAPDRDARKADLYVMNADGSGRKRIVESPPNTFAISPCWSPDGKQIYFAQLEIAEGGPMGLAGRLVAVDADGKNMRRVGDVKGLMPAVSPDGKRILSTVMDTTKGFDPRLFVVNADGTAPRQLLEGKAMAAAWSPDGKKIAYMADPGDNQPDIYIADADGSNAVRLTKTKEPE